MIAIKEGNVLRKLIVLAIAIFSLLPNKSFGGHNKFPRYNKVNAPIEVELFFDSVPLLNHTVTLNFKVTPLQDAPNTLIKIELPEEYLRVISGDIELVENLYEGITRIYQVEILPFALGKFKITASAISRGDEIIFGKTTELFINLGDTVSEVTKNNILLDPTTISEIEKISDFSLPPAELIPDSKRPPVQKIFNFSAPGAGQIVVRGYWYYGDKNYVDKPLRRAGVEIWDLDSSGDDLLDTTYTDNNGYYESETISNIDDEGGGQEIYVKVFSTDDHSVMVTDLSSISYSAQTSTYNNVSDGFVDIGSTSLTDANNRMAWYIYDIIANDAYDYLYNNVGWDNSYNLQVRWSPTNTSEGTHYNPGGTIDLIAGDRWDEDVFLHEYGHFVMYKIYGDIYPSTPNCENHSWDKHSSLGCAWVEGWATFLQGAIQGHQDYVDTEDQTNHYYMEPPTPLAHHAEDEGAVLASLWDIYDSGLESWDSLNNNINGSSNNGIWRIVYSNKPTDVLDFYDEWINSSNGYNSEVASIFLHHLITQSSFCIDNDGDEYGNPGSSSCPQGHATDCDDNNASVNPGATEGPFGNATCIDGKDNNCDTKTDTADYNCQQSDLVISTLKFPLATGLTITVGDTTKNMGKGTAGESTTKFYWSTDNIYDTGDTPFKNRRVIPPLAPKGLSLGNTLLTIPAGASTGTYYIIAIADGDEVVPETNEVNNHKSKTIKIKLDLTVSSLTAPTSASEGSTITITDTTMNKGKGYGQARESQTCFYLSIDKIPDAGEKLACRTAPSLISGQSNTSSTNAVIPSGMAAGIYYIIVNADDSSVVNEAKEKNNKRYKKITISPLI